jgi:hypothetical protein
MGVYCNQVKIDINYDWQKLKSAIQKILLLKDQHTDMSDDGAAIHYYYGSLGAISDHKDSNQWLRLSGPVVQLAAPGIVEFVNSLTDLQIDNWSISVLTGDGAEHVDRASTPSALNFIIECSDIESYAWVNDNGICETYPSEVNTAWILDTQHPHGIKNNGVRYTLSIHFQIPYNELKEWFKIKGLLIE